MKKIITLLMVVVMVAISSISIFAAPEGFVESPKADTPSLVSFTNESAECLAELIITPFVRIDELEETKEKENRDAYNEIVKNNDSFAKVLAKLAASKNIPVSKLAVSELFDVSYKESGGHNGHGAFTISIKAKNLDKFVGLMNRHTGEWVIINNAKVNGDILTFTVSELSPFAIIVDTEAGENVPGTEAPIPAHVWICAALAGVSFAMIIAVVFKSKKVKE